MRMHWDRDRMVSAIAAVALPGLGILALLHGLAVSFPRVIDDELASFAVSVEPPPPPLVRIEPARQRVKRPEGAAAPPNLRSEATEIVAPAPVVVTPPPPPPVIAAPVPSTGLEATSGASDRVGPGTGAGGIGNGRGSGAGGDGDGGGWEDEIPPRWISGRLKFSDLPENWDGIGNGRPVEVRYTVDVNGRVRDCRIDRSSGSRLIDVLTCRLIEQRFRYRPSRDARGRPVPSTIVESHSWFEQEDPERH
jgi:protein TonB